MLRVLELFCGIGGCATALSGAPLDRLRARVVAAVDIHRGALGVYARNHPHPVQARKIEMIPASELRAWDADLWWLSPPCQPFTTRGLQRDADDPRARPFLAVIERLAEIRPRWVGLENVPGFLGSRVHARLRATLEQAGYAAVCERLLCPSELGVPNRRRRYYLVASRDTLRPLPEVLPAVPLRRLRDYLDAESQLGNASGGLDVEPEILRGYEGALHIVDADDPAAVTNCFTSAYGRSHVRSGSYLRIGGCVRRFSPSEILRLLGFPASFTLPPEMPARTAWRLVGNSLSLEPVRTMLALIPSSRRWDGILSHSQ